MSGYNEAKYEILSLVDELDEATSRQIADATYRTIHSASRNLCNYHRQGLLNRYRMDGEYVYSLSDRGRERLDWLEKVFEEDDVTEVFLWVSRNRCRVVKLTTPL